MGDFGLLPQCEGQVLSKTVASISATGSSKSALGKLFIAKPDASGRYVLNLKKSAAASGRLLICNQQSLRFRPHRGCETPSNR